MVQQINEPMEFLDSAANVTISINGEDATLKVGGNSKDGRIYVHKGDGNLLFSIDSTSGQVEILDPAGDARVRFDAATGDILVTRQIAGATRDALRFNAASGALYLGGPDISADLLVRDAAGRNVLLFNSLTAGLTVGDNGSEGNLTVQDGAGRQVFRFDGASAALYLGAEGNEGDLIIRDGAGRTVFHFDAESSALYLGAEGNEGDLLIRNGNGVNSFQVDGDQGDIIVRRGTPRAPTEVLRFDASNAALYIGNRGYEGDLIIRDGSARQVFHFDSQYAALYLGAAGNEGDLILRNTAGSDTVKIDGGEGDIFVWRNINGVNREVLRFDASHAALYVGSEGNEGDIIVRDGSNREVFHFDSNYAALYVGANGNEGDVIVRDGNGNERIRLDGGNGDILLTGADCAEDFCVTSEVEPGTIMVIETDDILRPCDLEYDRRVAGVISGAGGLNPGITMGKRSGETGRQPLALSGKVFCKVDADIAPIEVGDLLTTSPTRGHAMKAADVNRAFGAVIGKAMKPLKSGKGVLPVLVALQ